MVEADAAFLPRFCRDDSVLQPNQKEKNAVFEYPLADRPLRRSRYGRSTRKPMGKESAAAIHRRFLLQKSSTADEQRGAAKTVSTCMLLPE